MKKDDLCAAIRRMKQEYPDWRVGQIVSNVATWAKGPEVSSVWDITDEEFIAAVEKHLATKNKKR